MKHQTSLLGAWCSISGVKWECQPNVSGVEMLNMASYFTSMQLRAPLARVAGPRVMSVLQKRAVPAYVKQSWMLFCLLIF